MALSISSLVEIGSLNGTVFATLPTHSAGDSLIAFAAARFSGLPTILTAGWDVLATLPIEEMASLSITKIAVPSQQLQLSGSDMRGYSTKLSGAFVLVNANTTETSGTSHSFPSIECEAGDLVIGFINGWGIGVGQLSANFTDNRYSYGGGGTSTDVAIGSAVATGTAFVPSSVTTGFGRTVNLITLVLREAASIGPTKKRRRQSSGVPC